MSLESKVSEDESLFSRRNFFHLAMASGLTALVSPAKLFAQDDRNKTITIAGMRIELIDNKMSDTDAERVYNYAKNALYADKNFTKAYNVFKMIHTYNGGKFRDNALYYMGKCSFKIASDSFVPDSPQGIAEANKYVNHFKEFYFKYPDSDLIKDGSFEKLMTKALEKETLAYYHSMREIYKFICGNLSRPVKENAKKIMLERINKKHTMFWRTFANDPWKVQLCPSCKLYINSKDVEKYKTAFALDFVKEMIGAYLGDNQFNYSYRCRTTTGLPGIFRNSVWTNASAENIALERLSQGKRDDVIIYPDCIPVGFHFYRSSKPETVRHRTESGTMICFNGNRIFKDEKYKRIHKLVQNKIRNGKIKTNHANIKSEKAWRHDWGWVQTISGQILCQAEYSLSLNEFMTAYMNYPEDRWIENTFKQGKTKSKVPDDDF